MTAAITVDKLTKRYGVHAAVDGVSFEVARGEVVGFLGPNGAGKSTTLRILVGFLGATSGRATIEGHDVAIEPDAARAVLGYMPEAVPLYGEMRVREYLRFRAELKGVPRAQRVSFIGNAMELARVTDVADTLIEHLSKGYRQRVGLADALVSKPRVLVLDEPTAGMDPNQIREVRDLIKSLGGEHTVLLSTHILPEVEASCSRVVVIDKGKLVAQGAPQELSAFRAPPRLDVIVRGEEAAWRRAIEAAVPPLKLVSSRPDGELFRLEISADRETLGEASESLVSALVKENVKVRSVAPGKASLEEVFAALTADPVAEKEEAEEEAKEEAES
ncbi:MAG: ABC transporter ATP-binding protein [Polyangiales bacterium]